MKSFVLILSLLLLSSSYAFCSQLHDQDDEDILGDVMDEEVTIQTQSNDPGKMLSEYLSQAYGPAATQIQIIQQDQDDDMDVGSMKAGLISVDTAVDKMRDGIDRVVDQMIDEESKEDGGVPSFIAHLMVGSKVSEAKDAIEKKFRAMADQGTSYALDSAGKNECGKPESRLLLISPSDKTVGSFELNPCDVD